MKTLLILAGLFIVVMELDRLSTITPGYVQPSTPKLPITLRSDGHYYDADGVLVS